MEKRCPQGLKPLLSERLLSEQKLRPPKRQYMCGLDGLSCRSFRFDHECRVYLRRGCVVGWVGDLLSCYLGEAGQLVNLAARTAYDVLDIQVAY